jgi:hypothetical protein
MTRHGFALAIALLVGVSVAGIPAQKSSASGSDSRTSNRFDLTVDSIMRGPDPLFVDGGDVVLVDSVRGTRRQITRTTGSESNPRWARNDTHVTYVRDGILELFEDNLRTPHNGKGT